MQLGSPGSSQLSGSLPAEWGSPGSWQQLQILSLPFCNLQGTCLYLYKHSLGHVKGLLHLDTWVHHQMGNQKQLTKKTNTAAMVVSLCAMQSSCDAYAIKQHCIKPLPTIL